MNTILYPPRYSPTARRLAEALGLRRNSYRGLREQDTVIRWGDTRNDRCYNSHFLNSLQSIRGASDKLGSLTLLARDGLSVPPRANPDSERYPLIARTFRHSGGNGLWIVRSSTEAAQAVREGADYFLELVGSKREYRLHVMRQPALTLEDGRVQPEGLAVIYSQMKMGQRRTSEQREGLGRYIRSRQYGWWLNTATPPEVVTQAALRAVETLGLDFGGVDILYCAGNRAVVLEVNTAPGLSGPALPIYVQAFKKLLDGNSARG